jgi:uncharacterized protein YndB with AHSA1/START domain
LREGGPPTAPEVIRKEIVLPASPAEVWDALTDGKDMSRWFGAEVEMAPRLGGQVRFRWPDGVERGAVIEALETERLLVLRWLPFERDADGKARRRPGTTVRFTLGPRDEKTVLVVEETLPAPPEEWPADAVDRRGDPKAVHHVRAGAER